MVIAITNCICICVCDADLKKPDSLPTHFMSSMLSGAAVTTAMNPLDVVSTRLYNQSSNTGERYYKGWIDCVLKTARAEGWHGFYKGYTAQYLRLGPRE
jgi:solute carrier family 25 protein 34/35